MLNSFKSKWGAKNGQPFISRVVMDSILSFKIIL